MKQRILLAALLCGSMAHAQTSITAASGSLRMGGVVIASGSVTFAPVDVNGNPIAFENSGGGLNSPKAFAWPIANGGISGTFNVPDACLSSPANILYTVQVTKSGTFESFTLPKVVGVCGSSWALDHYGPPAKTSNVTLAQTSHGNGAYVGSCTAPSFYTRDDTQELYMCIAGSMVVVSSSGGGSQGPAGPTGPTGATGATGAAGADGSDASVTAANMKAALAGLTGCATSGYVWSVHDAQCINPYASPSDGVHPGAVALIGNTTELASLTANYFYLLGPNSASFAGFGWQAPTATNANAGVVHVAANSSAISQLSVSPVALSDMTTQAADTAVMNATAGSAAPTAVAMPSGCTTGVNYSTATHTWTCPSAAGGNSSYLSTASIGAAIGQQSVGSNGGGSQVSILGIVNYPGGNSLGHVLVHSDTPDATATDFYMLGVIPFGAAGSSQTPLCSTGPLAGGSSPVSSTGGTITALAAPCSPPGGTYLVIGCGVATVDGPSAEVWKLWGDGGLFQQIPYISFQSASTCSSSGFPSTVTLPAAGVNTTNGTPEVSFVP